MKKGFILVVSSPSGAGKTTVIKKLMSNDKTLVKVTTATTRNPRTDEKNGRDYYFLTEQKFKNAIKQKKMLEWSKVYGFYYGILKKSLADVTRKDKILVLVIDIQGAGKIKKMYPDAVYVFMMPPSYTELKKRLFSRSGTGTNSRIRLKNAREEIKNSAMYDYIVVNDSIKNAVDDLKAIIRAEKLKNPVGFRGSPETS